MLRSHIIRIVVALRRGLYPLYHEEEGAHLVLVSIMLTALLGFAGLAIDGSNIYYQQQRMQIAADAAALAGARQLALNADTETVDATVHRLATENYATAVEWELINGDRGLRVVASRTFESFFAKVYGHDTFTVRATAKAQYEPVTGTDDLFPLTIDCDCVDDGEPIPPLDPPGQDIPIDDEEPEVGCSNLYPIALSTSTLAGKSSGDPLWDIYNGVQPGNFGWLSWEGTPNTPDLVARLTPPGNSHLYINPYNPNDHVLSVGDWVYGSPGVANASEVRAALDVLKTMDITVPVWDEAAGNGSNAVYHVVAFARVRITDYRLPSQNRISATFLGYDETCSGGAANSGTVAVVDSEQFEYEVRFVSHVDSTWTYQIRKVSGGDLSHWNLGINTCLNNITGTSPAGTPGVDSATGFSGIKWTAGAGFDIGVYSFTLDGDYPAGVVNAQVAVGSYASTAPIRGPICDGSTEGDEENPPSEGICLPTIDFETNPVGASLLSGDIVNTQWYAWGVQVDSASASHPPMIFDSANPTGNDPDLGSPNEDFGGPGVGAGGRSGMPGQNSSHLGKVLIAAETTNSANPDDAANGGTLIFTFDYPTRIDEVHVLDIDDASAAGSVTAYDAPDGGNVVATGQMLGLGDNSFQVVPVDGANVRRLEVRLPKGGAVPAIVSCRSQLAPTYRLGDRIWADANQNGLQDSGESGIPNVELELYATGQSHLIARTRTNAGGEYHFSNLPAGSYDVQIAASNFASGGPLANALYSSANAGADDKDSDFNPSTGRATAVVPLNQGDNFTLDGGFFVQAPVVEVGPDTGIFLLSDSKNTAYEIALVQHTEDTWTYRLKKTNGRDLNYWELGIASCVDYITDQSPSSGFSKQGAGVRWSVSGSFTERLFSITLDGNHPKGSTTAKISTTNNKTATIEIAGPDCSGAPIPPEEPEEPEEPGEPEEPAEPPVCSFSWLDWNGVTSSYQELRDNMNDTSRSGTWYVGDVVQPGPPVSPNIYTEQELNERIGKKVRIPLSNYNGSGYAICGFAEVTLLNYELQDENRWLSLDWLISLIHSAESDPAGPDFGAYDVRVLPVEP